MFAVNHAEKLAESIMEAGAQRISSPCAMSTNDKAAPEGEYNEEDAPLNRGEIQELVHHCLTNKLPVSISNLASGAMEEGSFSSGYAQALSFHLSAGIQRASFKHHTPIAVSFILGSRAYSFLTRVLRFDEASAGQRDYCRLVVHSPTQIASLECRRSIRIPVPRQSALRIDLKANDAMYTDLRAADLSTSGTLVTMPAGANAMRVDQEVVVTLRHGDSSIDVNAVVRRRRPDACGLLFAAAEADKGIDASVRRIVARVEREWLRARRDTVRSA